MANPYGLVIVHLSSLDAYTDEKGQSQGEALGYEIGEAIRLFSGPVFVTDQEWEYCGKQCLPRKYVEEVLQSHSHVVPFYHDESIHEWEEAMQKLGHLIRSCGVSHLTIGGMWASKGGVEEGCVNETHQLLVAQGFSCQVDPTICGMVED